MKFKITFQVPTAGQELPLSYQYELSSWIYHLIANANAPFARFLHDKGYVSEQRQFKFFSFSQMWVPNGQFRIQKDRMQIYAKEISFEVSFLVDEAAQALIIGLFQEQQLKLGDRYSQVDLFVKNVECLPLPEFEDKIRLRSASPIVVSAPNLQTDKLQHSYLSPLDSGFEGYFFKNLTHKYIAAAEHGLVPPVRPDFEQLPTHFKLLSEPNRVNSRLVTLKAFTKEQTKVRGFFFDFELEAPWELIRIGLLAGFGEGNSMGFGAVRRIG